MIESEEEKRKKFQKILSFYRSRYAYFGSLSSKFEGSLVTIFRISFPSFEGEDWGSCFFIFEFLRFDEISSEGRKLNYRGVTLYFSVCSQVS